MDQSSISLQPEDVPGATFRAGVNIEDHANFELQRWLECRGLKKTGSKVELVQRAINCIQAGRENIISLAVDGGKWYDRKRNNVVTPSSSTVLSEEPVVWARFPSRDIPQYFNKGHIYTFLVGCFFENEDYEVADESGVTEKPFRRGSQFVNSDHLYEHLDSSDTKSYYLKAKCFASFHKTVSYSVTIKLNKASGAVICGKCECKQSALGKCSHVSALLLFLEKYVQQNGYDSTASTSKPRQWGLGAKNKKPGPIAAKKYGSARFNPIKRAVFDPRPIEYTRHVNLNNFICDLQKESQATMFETLLKLQYEDFAMESITINILIEQVRIFRTNMQEFMARHMEKVFAVEGAEIQRSEGWCIWRSYFITSSNAKAASSLVTSSAKSNFIKRNLWQLTPKISTPAMKYGQIHEKDARQQYVAKHIQVNEQLLEVGLYVNKDYPYLACSADGVVTTNGIITRIIEIKCPKVIEGKNPSDCDCFLSPTQKSTFFAYKENGKVHLKAYHPYMYQVATSMMIFDVPECDFVVWSSVGLLVFKVKLSDVDHAVIDNITTKIKKFYYNMYVPDLFLMKIPRDLPLYELDYFE